MNTEGYLILSNVITGALLVMTCSFACYRRRGSACPYCGAHVQTYDMKRHIDSCNVRLGAVQPTVQAVPLPLPLPLPLPQEQVYAVAVPLPPATYYGNAKVADI
jgi:hypothetical protein